MSFCRIVTNSIKNISPSQASCRRIPERANCSWFAFKRVLSVLTSPWMRLWVLQIYRRFVLDWLVWACLSYLMTFRQVIIFPCICILCIFGGKQTKTMWRLLSLSKVANKMRCYMNIIVTPSWNIQLDWSSIYMNIKTMPENRDYITSYGIIRCVGSLALLT